MLLQAIDLVVRHHPSHPPVVDGVSLAVAPGEVVAVVGPNGSGKSTLARALAGLVALESGRLVGPSGGAPRVGLVLQDPAAQLVAATVADELALGPQAARYAPAQVVEAVQSSLARFAVGDLAGRDPVTLSGGQQQAVAVAAIDACDVDVLVLDEPTALLDPAARGRLGELLRHPAPRGVVWITQEPDEVAASDRVVVLDAGVVAWQGATDDFLADPSIAATWGLDLPAATRMAHALAAADRWQAGAAFPRSTSDLLAALGIDEAPDG